MATVQVTGWCTQSPKTWVCLYWPWEFLSKSSTHTHRRPSHTFPIWIFFIDWNLISRSLFLLLFLFLLFSLSYRRSRFRSNLITRKISLFLLLLLLFLLARNDIKYRKIIRHEDFIASRRIMDTKGLMAIDIHVQYRKIIKSVEIVESILRSLVSFYSRISSSFLYTSEFVFCTCSHDPPLLFRINIAWCELNEVSKVRA